MVEAGSFIVNELKITVSYFLFPFFFFFSDSMFFFGGQFIMIIKLLSFL